MTDLEVKQKLDNLKLTFAHGRYWNHDPNDEATDEDKRNGINHPNSVRDVGCSHHPSCNYGGDCGCNAFYSSIQCAGFALYMANCVFGSYPHIRLTQSGISNGQVDDYGWTYYTNGNFSGLTLSPGDIVYQKKSNGQHYAIVHEVNDNGYITFGEVLGGLNCLIFLGGF